ncbi:MAG: type II secretion system F family protein [Pirellulaceae bacterium]|nr:type II secretion system F family protein [Pirellulaceae bacterium]
MLSETSGALNPNVVLAIGASLFMLMVLSTVAVTAFSVLRPRMRLKRRMAELGLVGAAATGGGGGKVANPKEKLHKRTQEKLQEMEDRVKQKKRSNQIRSDLLQAGLEISVRNYLMLMAITGLVAVALSILFGVPVFAAIPICLIAFFGLPKLLLKFLARGRRKKFTAHFAGAIDIIVRGLRSGLPVGECLAIIGREIPDPVGHEFRLLIEGQEVGVALDELLQRGLERIPTAEHKFFAIVLLVHQQTGGNLAETLASLSVVLRERKKMKDKVQALSSEAKSSATIIGALPFFVMGMVSLINPEYMKVLFTETLGQFLLAAGITWMAIGVAAMWKMINFKM